MGKFALLYKQIGVRVQSQNKLNLCQGTTVIEIMSSLPQMA